MTLEGSRRIAAHATAGFAFAAAAVGGEIPGAAVALFVAAFGLSLALPGRMAGARAGFVTALAALAFAALTAAWLSGALDLVVAATTFAAALAASRLLARRSAADDGLLYLSSLLMLAGGSALTADLAYGLFFAAFSLCATSALTLSHLSRAAEEARAPRHRADALASRRLFFGVSALSVLGLLGAIAVFFAFPRFTAGVWSRSRGSGPDRAAAGFTGTIRLGGAGPLKSDARIAIRAAIEPDPGVDRLDLLWKGRSLDRFDGDTFQSTARGGGPAHRDWPLGPGLGDLASLEVEVRPAAQALAAFMPQGAQRVWNPRRVPAPSAGAGLALLQLRRDASGDLEVWPAPEAGYSYSARAALFARPQLAGRGLAYPEEIRARYLQLPALDPRVSALAARWTEGLSDPFDKAQAIERGLGAFGYSAELPGETADPLAQFLVERKAGHCELFATAMTVLLRASGVPARVATGFHGGNRLGPGLYALRVGDAHAWSEVFFPGLGFVAFDPTPPLGRSAAPGRANALLAELYDRAEVVWLSAVVDYDLRDQIGAAKMALKAMSLGLERFQGRGGSGGALAFRLAAASAIIATAIGAIRLALRLPGRSRRRLASDEVAALYRRLLRRLARRGLEKLPGQTPREFATRLSAERRAEAPEVSAITERYLAARFGKRRLEAGELRELDRRVRAL